MKWNVWGLLFAFFLIPIVHADKATVLKPSIILTHIDTVRAHEQGGDELYFDVSVIRANQPREFFRIPKHPIHWPSLLSSKIKEVILWSEPIQPNETVILLLALMDEDPTPINPDDLIGLIRVELKNKNGQLQVHWTIPNRSVGPVTIAGKKGDIQKFELFGEHGQYDVYLSLK
ncbi:hypothetical protein [Legionella impletisoli]|uniref:Uncharacterized protein n=1 Tax=Legionella impletisoli TaxID=343510 RepID=A0A917JVC8_9GAMM|nr:hypothetical protein [Legionella impletisoli]GGI86395.1 hypothetical protein GCM10007966_13780 [Legionella impletisoli]